MRLIALQEFTYSNVPLKVGDRFIADSAEDARLLKGLGKATDDVPLVRTTALRAESFEPETKAKRNRYKRADVRAED